MSDPPDPQELLARLRRMQAEQSPPPKRTHASDSPPERLTLVPDDDAFMPAFRRHDPRERRQRQADLLMAIHLYRFASRQLVFKLTSMQVVIPVEIAEGLSLVEGWTGEMLPSPREL